MGMCCLCTLFVRVHVRVCGRACVWFVSAIALTDRTTRVHPSKKAAGPVLIQSLSLSRALAAECGGSIPCGLLASSGPQAMDFWNFNLQSLTGCCTCVRKHDVVKPGEKEYYQRGGEHARSEKPQLGGVGIVFQGTEDGGLKVSPRSTGLHFCCTVAQRC